MSGSIGYYQICTAPHYFSHADIGKKFVRTAPCGGDSSFIPESSDISAIGAKALTLMEFHADYLKFKGKELRTWPGYEVYKLWRKYPEKWDDGRWICIDAFAQGLSGGSISLNPIPARTGGGCDDWY